MDMLSGIILCLLPTSCENQRIFYIFMQLMIRKNEEKGKERRRE